MSREITNLKLYYVLKDSLIVTIVRDRGLEWFLDPAVLVRKLLGKDNKDIYRMHVSVMVNEIAFRWNRFMRKHCLRHPSSMPAIRPAQLSGSACCLGASCGPTLYSVDSWVSRVA